MDLRYLRTAPRMVSRYPWGQQGTGLEVYVDADHAGCKQARRSTLGGAVMWNGKFIKSWSKTMEIIALSSGESELVSGDQRGRGGARVAVSP